MSIEHASSQNDAFTHGTSGSDRPIDLLQYVHTTKIPPPTCQVYISISPLEKRFSFLFFHLSHLRCFPSLVSPIKVDCEKVLGGDAGSPRQRRVVLHARGRDERRRRVEEGRVRARAHQFAKS